jgi:SAM-dependent methyltransferase
MEVRQNVSEFCRGDRPTLHGRFFDWYHIQEACLPNRPRRRSRGARVRRYFGRQSKCKEHCMNWFHRQVCRSERWRRRLEKDLLPWALEGVELRDDVLEIGPGPGLTTELLRSRTQRLTALEIDAAAAIALERRLTGTGVRVVHGDGAAMPFADGSFSGVVSFTMLHHVPTMAMQDRLLAEARRVLRPGGVFAGFDGIGSFLFRLIHLGDTYNPVDPRTLGQRLEGAGFTNVAIEIVRGGFRFRATSLPLPAGRGLSSTGISPTNA